MFTIAWGAREGGHNVCQLHLHSLPSFPPRLVDRGVFGEVAPPRASFAWPARPRRGRNPYRHKSRESRTQTPHSASSKHQTEAVEEVAAITLSKGGEEAKEEQLCPHQRRRMSRRRPSIPWKWAPRDLQLL